MNNRYEWALEVLGLERGATQAEIKQAYRDLVAVWHPDKFAGNERLMRKAEAKLKEINLAKDFLEGKGYSDAWEETSRNKWQCPPDEEESEAEAEQANYDEDEKVTDPNIDPDTAGQQNGSSKRRFLAGKVFWIASTLIILVAIGVFTYKSGSLKNPAVAAANKSVYPLTTQARAPGAKLTPSVDKAEGPQIPKLEPDDDRWYRSPNGNLWHWKSDVPPTKSDLDELINEDEELTKLLAPKLAWFRKVHSREPNDAERIQLQKQTISESPRSASGSPKQSHNQTGSNEDIHPQGFFTLGSSKDDVKTIQGVPTAINSNSFEYDFSIVYFDGDNVVGYADISHNLKVKLVPSEPSSGNEKTFTIGSKKDEVLAVQGTPTSVSSDSWSYEFSIVEFRDGKVSGYSNISKNLKVR